MNVIASQPPIRSSLRAAAPPPPPTPHQEREGPGVVDVFKNMVGVTAFGAGPAMAAAQWGLPGAVLGVAASCVAMKLISGSDSNIMVPFTGLCSGVLSLAGLFGGWPGAIVVSGLAAAYGWKTA